MTSLVQKFNEYTVLDLKGGAEPKVKKRSKRHQVFFEKVDKNGTVHFKTTSDTTPNKDFWYQQIQLVDLALWFGIDDINLKERAKTRLALLGDIKIFCDCPAHLYWGGRYILTQMKAALPPLESRFPKVRNPSTSGTGCKHLQAVLRVLPFHQVDIMKSAKKLYGA